MKKVWFALTMAVAASALADVTVTGVKVLPRSPWNGLVDIDYFIVSDNEDDDVYVNPVGYDGDRGITMFPTSFTGDGADAPVKPGKHRMTWDAKKDFGRFFSCANFQIKLYVGKRLPRYVIVDLSGGSEAENYPTRFSAVGPDIADDACRTTELWLRLVPPGEFVMGSPDNELGRDEDEDLHKVVLTKPFYMGIFEVTQKQWELVMGEKVGYFSLAPNSDVRPVESVRWDAVRDYNSVSPEATRIDAKKFLGALRARTGNVCIDFPTEVRWEYACRAGTTTALYNGRNLASIVMDRELSKMAGYEANCHANQDYERISVDVGTRKVGSYLPNALGLYDMLGNVGEWCLDVGCNSNTHLGFKLIVDPKVCADDFVHNDLRVSRGAGWRHDAKALRAAERGFVSAFDAYDDLGFRICAEAGF